MDSNGDEPHDSPADDGPPQHPSTPPPKKNAPSSSGGDEPHDSPTADGPPQHSSTTPLKKNAPSNSPKRSPHKIKRSKLQLYQHRKSSPRKKQKKLERTTSTTVATTSKKRPVYFTKNTPKFSFNGKTKFNEKEKEAALDYISREHCGYDAEGINGCRVCNMDYKYVSTKEDNPDRRRVSRCAYCHDADCPCRLEEVEVRDRTDHSKVLHCYIRISECNHADHTRYSNTKVVPKLFKAYLQSSSDNPSKVVTRIRNDGFMINAKMEQMILDFVTYAKTPKSNGTNSKTPGGLDQNSWELLVKKVKAHQQEFIDKHSFPDPKNSNGYSPLEYYHEPFVVGQVVIKPAHPVKKNRVIIVISTKNLLLNAVRQRQCGMGFALHCDASYSYTVDQHFGLLPIIVSSPSQEGRLVATAIVNKEDHLVHEHIFRQIKQKVEDVMEELNNNESTNL